MNQQLVRQAAWRSALDAQAVLRKERAVRWSSVELMRVPGLAVWWTRGSDAAVMAGMYTRGTDGAGSSSGRCYTARPKWGSGALGNRV
jgi:hypothetical protein